MKPIFIGIAGGSGAGKSTLCTSLLDAYPNVIGLIQLDDYFRPESDVPEYHGHKNWDHPNALYLDRLANDLEQLSMGHAVFIHTKNERLNPEYATTEKRIPVSFDPKPILLVEGYLVLHDEDVRDHLDLSVWLDIDHDIRWKRRVHFKYDAYEKDVLIPMHKKFAEPSKTYADHILTVTDLSKDEVFKSVQTLLQPYL